MARFDDSPALRPSFTRGPATPAQTPRQAAAGRPNRYAAKCSRCGGWVEAGIGNLESRGGSWVVSHIQPCPDPEAQHEPVAKPSTVTKSEPVAFSVPDGRYTVVWEDGYKTIRVTHQDEFDDFMPGRTLLSYLSGSNNDRDYTRFAHVDESGSVRIWKKHQGIASLSEAVKVLLGDPKAASKAYARESGCCGVCGRTLTTPESISNGIGPVCAERTGF